MYSELFDQPDHLQQFKLLLKHNEAELKQKFDPHQSVSALIKERSDFIDNLLSSAWRHFLGIKAARFALIAVGGYGRRELFPYSDIDILVMLDNGEEDGDDSGYQEDLGNFFTFLWDISLKPGQSVRTISECVAEAIKNQTVMTSLTEIRLITGNPDLFDELKEQTSPDHIWPSDLFFQAKMAEQEQRYAKAHNTAYNLEPNVKEGPGGLRDMQVIAWVFKRHYHSSTLKELIKYNFMPESEYNELIAAREVLWRIRYALHLLTQRGEDRLIFDYQRDLAQQFGFSGADQQYNQDVERFMQFYFKTVQGLERLNEMLLQLFNERFVCGETGCRPTDISEDFVAINGYLEAVDEDVFTRNPLLLLKIFLILQQNTSLSGIRATTIRLIRKNLHLMDDAFRTDKAANQLFIELLRQPRGITTQLKRMNRYGVLAAYLPSFANIVARMQYDLFHIYTVDEHTLFVIRNLRRFSIEAHCNEMPFCHKVFLQIQKPELLYLGGLFHDIAKGRNGDHSTIGEDIAYQFCLQHGLSNHDSKLTAWLVRNHLMMSMTAQRKDISDIDVIHEFAQLVGSIEYLNYLYLLTVADIRATNPELWNSWKDVLLKELYNKTHSVLHKGLQNPVTLAERLAENKAEAKDELRQLGLCESVIDKTWHNLSDDYFLRYATDEIVWHTRAIAYADPADLPMVLLEPHTQRGSAEIFVYTENCGPIFSLCTATLDQLGLTILDARIMTTLNDYTLNSFQVLEQSGEPIQDHYREEHIRTALQTSLRKQEVKKHKNLHRQSRQARHFPIPTRIQFLDDPLGRHTVIELVTTDRAGLLSQIGQAFIKQHINLHSAKITTIGSRAEDLFYVTDPQNQPITDPVRQQHIYNEMAAMLEAEH